MAVEISYVVVRGGKDKMTFSSKKEADAYDKMLDMADAFCDWLGDAPLNIDDAQREVLGLFLAERRNDVQHILRTSKVPPHAENSSEASDPVPEADTHPQEENALAESKKGSNSAVRAIKAA